MKLKGNSHASRVVGHKLISMKSYYRKRVGACCARTMIVIQLRGWRRHFPVTRKSHAGSCRAPHPNDIYIERRLCQIPFREKPLQPGGSTESQITSHPLADADRKNCCYLTDQDSTYDSPLCEFLLVSASLIFSSPESRLPLDLGLRPFLAQSRLPHVLSWLCMLTRTPK